MDRVPPVLSGERVSEAVPPTRRRITSRSQTLLYPLYGIGGLLLAVGGARLIELFPFPLPLCGFRLLTGLPCPFCGSTRCLMAWSHFEVTKAFQFNPLVATACVVLWGWALLQLIRYWLGRPIGIPVRLGRMSWIALGVAALANWIYLFLYLPK